MKPKFFFDMVQTSINPPPRERKRERERTQITNIRNKIEIITIEFMNIKNIIMYTTNNLLLHI